ncbi:MAG: 5'-deoxynucleotidase [Clostridia bacterium]|nr:5'-deoxynucleotidase [Clostridia bacterium]
MSNFFAVMARMKYINRWGLMRNTRYENLSEHSLDVAMISHALCVIGNRRLGKSFDADRAAILSVYHDCSEILTGDLPTPVKYFNREIDSVYHDIEDNSRRRLLSLLPDDIREEYDGILSLKDEDPELLRLVKAADKISAIIKCIEEKGCGNHEFDKAYSALTKAVERMDIPEANIFMEEFLPGYALSLDEQGI